MEDKNYSTSAKAFAFAFVMLVLFGIVCILKPSWVQKTNKSTTIEIDSTYKK